MFGTKGGLSFLYTDPKIFLIQFGFAGFLGIF